MMFFANMMFGRLMSFEKHHVAKQTYLTNLGQWSKLCRLRCHEILINQCACASHLLCCDTAPQILQKGKKTGKFNDGSLETSLHDFHSLGLNKTLLWRPYGSIFSWNPHRTAQPLRIWALSIQPTIILERVISPSSTHPTSILYLLKDETTARSRSLAAVGHHQSMAKHWCHSGLNRSFPGLFKGVNHSILFTDWVLHVLLSSHS